MNDAGHIADRPSRVRIERLLELIARVRLWLGEMLLWFADVAGDGPLGDALRTQLRRDLARTRDGIRAVLVLMAIQAAMRRPARQRARCLGAPRGFRYRRHTHDMRNVTRGIPFRGRNLREHCEALARVIDAIERCAAHVRTRLDAPDDMAPLAVRPPSVLLAGLPCVAPRPADSS
jgi:hypothetical protein